MAKNTYWHSKNVFVTGVNGFIGGNLAKELLNQGANIFGLMRNENKNTFIYYEEIADKINLIYGELWDKELMCRIISEEQISVVFHLAAQVEIGVGIINPYLTYETNIRGSYTLLDAIRQFPHSIQAVVVASSDKAYGSYEKDKMPYKEEYSLKPRYPYDTSKACADMIAQAYASEIYKLPVVVTRFCNIYGPGQLNYSAIIPDAITSALGYKKFIPRGDGTAIRDFIFVEDVVDLYLKIGEALAINPQKMAGEIFNAGNNSPISVREVLKIIYALLCNDEDFKEVIAQMKDKKTTGEIDCQYMDFEKVNKFLGWSPRHNIEEGLKKTIAWFKRYNEYRFKI